MTLVEEVHRLRDKCADLVNRVDVLEDKQSRTHEQINGERGISATLNTLSGEIHSLRKGMYWVAGLIVASSIAFAFSVLVFFA